MEKAERENSERALKKQSEKLEDLWVRKNYLQKNLEKSRAPLRLYVFINQIESKSGRRNVDRKLLKIISDLWQDRRLTV